MKLKLVLLHFRGLTSLFKGYMTSIVGLIKAIFIIVGGLVAYYLVTGGVSGVVAYVQAIDLQLLVILIATLVIVLSVFAVVTIGVINLIASIRYCKENDLKLREFYSLSETEILKLWDYKE